MINTALFVYTFAAFGIAYICGFSKISYPFRVRLGQTVAGNFFMSLIECPACFGFWLGALAGICASFVFVNLSWWALAIILGAYTSGTNFILGVFTGLMKE